MVAISPPREGNLLSTYAQKMMTATVIISLTINGIRVALSG
jgi:hypothetical protein